MTPGSSPGRLRVVAWNAEWAPPRGVRGRRVAEVLAAIEADVICLTEGHADVLPPGGHVAVGQDHGGGSEMSSARRVLLWSRAPLEGVDAIGRPDLPHQGFVSAVTPTPVGPVEVMSVCIPWADADVARFGGTRARWEQHRRYLTLLDGMLRGRRSPLPLVVAGDFNQYLPRIWGPRDVSELLCGALGPLEVATEGPMPGIDAHVIDHVAHTPDLRRAGRGAWAGRTPDGRPMSDHSGVWVDLVPGAADTRRAGQ